MYIVMVKYKILISVNSITKIELTDVQWDKY